MVKITETMNRSTIILLTDLILIPTFLLSVYTGIQLHTTQHIGDTVMSYIHISVSLLFLALVTVHVAYHRAWYRNLAMYRTGKRAKILILSGLFILTAASGLCTLAVKESQIGKLHHMTGMLTALFALLHILIHLRILKNMISQRITTKNGGNS